MAMPSILVIICEYNGTPSFICLAVLEIFETIETGGRRWMDDDLEVKKCAHAQSKSFPICVIKDDKISHSILIKMKVNFLPFIP